MQKVADLVTSNMVVQAALSIVVGLLLAIWPQTTTVTLVYILAACMAIAGITSIASYVRGRKKGIAKPTTVYGGVLLVIIAIVIFVAPQMVAGLFTIVCGAILILSGLFNGFRAVGLKALGGIAWIAMLIISVLIVIGGIVVIVNPFQTAVNIIFVLGLLLISKGLVDLATYYLASKTGTASQI